MKRLIIIGMMMCGVCRADYSCIDVATAVIDLTALDYNSLSQTDRDELRGAYADLIGDEGWEAAHKIWRSKPDEELLNETLTELVLECSLLRDDVE